MSTIPTIPDWAIFRASNLHRGGYRLPKKTAPHMARPNAWPTHQKYHLWTQTDYRPGFCSHTKNEDKSNWLSAGDFRVWGGDEHDHAYAACRCCGTVVRDKESRKLHRAGGCGRVLEDALRLLKRDPVCISCGEKTFIKHFGLPMCSKECREHFMYTEHRPQAVVAAVQLIHNKV